MPKQNSQSSALKRIVNEAPCPTLLIGVLLGLLLFTSGAQSQSKRPAPLVMSPVPAWPGEDALSYLGGKASAFYDFGSHQAVIATPDATRPTGYSVFRFDIPNGANATVESSVGPPAGGILTYSYMLNDSPQSAQRSHRLTILLPSGDSTLTQPRAVWASGAADTVLPDRTSTATFGTMRRVYWSRADARPERSYGLALSLTSTYLPGFADAYIEGYVATPFTASSLNGLSGDIATQASRFLQHGIGSSPYIVVAPLFRPDASRLVMASNYLWGIEALMQTGVVQPTKFLRELSAQLSKFVQSEGVAALDMPTVAPSGAIDTAIQQAAVMAFK